MLVELLVLLEFFESKKPPVVRTGGFRGPTEENQANSIHRSRPPTTRQLALTITHSASPLMGETHQANV